MAADAPDGLVASGAAIAPVAAGELIVSDAADGVVISGQVNSLTIGYLSSSEDMDDLDAVGGVGAGAVALDCYRVLSVPRVGFVTVGVSVPWIGKWPSEVLDYVLEFSDRLAAGETLTGCSVSADTGITVGASPSPAVNTSPLAVTLADGSSKTISAGEAVVVWLSGGADGGRYKVSISATTSELRTVQRSFEIRIMR